MVKRVVQHERADFEKISYLDTNKKGKGWSIKVTPKYSCLNYGAYTQYRAHVKCKAAEFLNVLGKRNDFFKGIGTKLKFDEVAFS